MEKVKVNSALEVAINMLEEASEGKYVYSVLFYEEAVAVMRVLLNDNDIDIFTVDICDPECNGYEKEYYLTLDPEMVLSCEPAWHEKNEYHDAGYLKFDADVIYIDGEAKSKILECCDSDAEVTELDLSDCQLYPAYLDDEEYDDEDYEDDDCDFDEDCDDCEDCCCEFDCSEKLEFAARFIELLADFLEDE